MAFQHSPQIKINLSSFRTGDVSLQGTACCVTPLFQVLLMPLRIKGYNEQCRQLPFRVSQVSLANTTALRVTFSTFQGRSCKQLLSLHPSRDRCQYRSWKVSGTENEACIKIELQLLQANVPYSRNRRRKPRETLCHPSLSIKLLLQNAIQMGQGSLHKDSASPHVAPQASAVLLLIYRTIPEIRIEPRSNL